jgi:TRAP-type mannitol/chloroaromatic compound transport system permease small subunit
MFLSHGLQTLRTIKRLKIQKDTGKIKSEIVLPNILYFFVDTYWLALYKSTTLYISSSGLDRCFVDKHMNFLKRLCSWIDTANEWVGRGVAWVTLGLVLVVFIDVVMRYLFKTSFVFTQELEWHLFAFIFLIGAGYTLLHDGHVRVDIIYQRLGYKGRAWINLIGVIFFLLPGCILVILTSWNFVYNSWSVMEGSPDPGGIPFRYLIKGTIPVGFFLLCLQGVSLGLHSLFQILGMEDITEETTS